jgi:ribonuclease Z
VDNFRVTLLGTGTPAFDANRSGISTLIEAGQQSVLIDCGRGTAPALQRAVGTLAPSVLLLTHLHSDHVSGIPDLWLTGFLPNGQRPTPLRLYGPKGTEQLAHHLSLAYAADFDARSTVRGTQGLTDEDARLIGSDFDAGVVYDDGGLRITSFEVDHGAIEPAFGFRVDFQDRSVVLSGDTRYSENLIEHSADVDLLIHEVAAIPDGFETDDPAVRRILFAHTLPEEVGRIWEQVHPKLGVYSHILYFGGATDDDIVSRTQLTYDGPFLVGQDSDRFEIATEVTKIE